MVNILLIIAISLLAYDFQPTALSSPVSYQTAFWTLVPLTISTMTQLSGRVLGSSPHFRTYLRSSPIVCSIDALFFVVRLMLSPIILRIPVSQAFDLTIRERYRDLQVPVEGIQYLEKQTWLQWLWFAVGTLGPTIKLAAMKGVPWTKTWGMMFLGAFIVFESMIFFKKKDGRGGLEPLAPDESASAPTLVLVNARIDYINCVERRAFILAVLIHSGVVLWAALDPWELRRPIYEATEEADAWGVYGLLPLSGISRTILALLAVLLIGSFGLYTLLSSLAQILCDWLGEGRDFSSRAADLRASVITMVYMIVIAFVAKAGQEKKSYKLPFLLDLSLGFLTLAAPLWLAWAIGWLCSKYPALSVNLLMVPEPIRGNRSPSGAVWTFLFFVINLVVCMLWYRLRYDPTGTVNPRWTGVFERRSFLSK